MTVDDPGLIYIRNYYRVPARTGTRIRFDYPEGQQQFGTIVGSTEGHYLAVDFGDGTGPDMLHPTWQVTYLGRAS